VTALGGDDVRVLEWERFWSAEVDRTHLRSRRPWAQIAHQGHARLSARESAGPDEAPARSSGEWGARTITASFNQRRRTLVQAARASLVGIASGGVRARGLGKSKGRERATADTMEGCPSRGCVPLNQGRVPAALASRVNTPRASRRAEPADGACKRKCAHRCLRGDGDTQRSGRFRWLLQPRARSRDVVRGVGTHGAELLDCGASVGDGRLQRSRGRLTGRSLAGRLATRGCTEPDRSKRATV